MKRFFAALLAVTLLVLSLAAIGEGVPEDWLNKYNRLAEIHSAPILSMSDFEYLSDDDLYAADLGNDMLLIAYQEPSSGYFVCAIQALTDDERTTTVAGCALAAFDSSLSFYDAQNVALKVLNQLSQSSDMYTSTEYGWLVMGARDDEGGVESVVIAFTYVGVLTDDTSGSDDIEGNIWEGLEPDTEEPRPTVPTPTKSPSNGRHQI